MEPDQDYRFLVCGQWRTSSAPVQVCSPFRGDPVAQVHRAGAADVEDAIAAAARAHPLTRRLPAYRRSAILTEVARRIAENRDFLAKVKESALGAKVSSIVGYSVVAPVLQVWNR